MAAHPAVTELLQILNLEPLADNCFRAGNEQQGGVRLFGGQVLAQALRAAGLTVEAGRAAHSLHAYFLLPGAAGKELSYVVTRVRDGRSFSMRNVRAIQGKREIFAAQISFQVAESGVEHQLDCPEYGPPEGFVDDVTVARRLDKKHTAGMPWMLKERAFEFRTLRPITAPPPAAPVNPAWLRARSRLDDDALLLHQCMLAYATDMGLVSTSLIPHFKQYQRRSFQGLSLDHAIWFHRPFRVDGWLMYDRDSPVSAFAKGLSRGSIYNSSGQLVASVMQEGLMRLRRR